jgi:hypothetical protein
VAVREVSYLGERLEQERLRIGDLLALSEFEELSEQKERELASEVRPVIRGLRNEQAKLEELRQRLAKDRVRLSGKTVTRMEREIEQRRAKQADLLRKLNLNQRVVDRIVARMRSFLERIEAGERELQEMARNARVVQADLRRCEEIPPEHCEIERYVEPLGEPARQDHRLVKAPFPQPSPVQRNRQEPLEDLHVPCLVRKIGHHSAQQIADPRLPPVLETMDGRQERLLVSSDRSCDRIGSFRDETLPAKMVFPCRGGKRGSAAGTEGGVDETDARHAGRAEGEGSVLLQRFSTGDAAGRKNEVGDPGQDLFQGYIPSASAFREAVSSGTAIRGVSDQSRSKS